MYKDSLSPQVFPEPWASAWGEDKYGLWMSFMIQNVSLRLRWCEPGTFMMGSPEGEQERTDYEALHEVTLTEGFWLAETTVTQALWEAVMGDNPSYFKGADRPVEMVSWDDAQRFIDRINKELPGLFARLPYEAEWEYGCRAGTTTPFSFGANITPEQVNYDGGYPYSNGQKGLYREETVAVKSLPCNDWGLYEMHGNAWEWCGDFWQDDLGSDPVVNPRGPKEGDVRLLRGGSWLNYGRNVRSAFRSRYDPSYRFNNLGFRLSRGH